MVGVNRDGARGAHVFGDEFEELLVSHLVETLLIEFVLLDGVADSGPAVEIVAWALGVFAHAVKLVFKLLWNFFVFLENVINLLD